MWFRAGMMESHIYRFWVNMKFDGSEYTMQHSIYMHSKKKKKIPPYEACFLVAAGFLLFF